MASEEVNHPVSMLSRAARAWLAGMLSLLCLASSGALAQSAGESQARRVPTGQGVASTLELPAPSSPAGLDKGSVTFVGNATVLIRYGGITILTDPNFLHKGDHVHLGYGLQAERLTNPAIEFDQLPPVDLVVLSHMHGDHFDQLVQEKLDRDMPIVTTHGAADQLEKMGFRRRIALNNWETLAVKKGGTTLRITSMPARHGPPVIAKAMPETMGSMLEFFGKDDRLSYRMYISGDTLVYDDIKEIPKHYPDIDLALLHLGGTRILKMVLVTMDARQGVEMMKIIAPQHAIPVHYNDYDVFKSPIEDFEAEIKAAGLQDRIVWLKHGESYGFHGKGR